MCMPDIPPAPEIPEIKPPRVVQQADASAEIGAMNQARRRINASMILGGSVRTSALGVAGKIGGSIGASNSLYAPYQGGAAA